MTLAHAFHVAEYVQLAANAVEGENSSGAKILAATWRETIKEETNGVLRVLRAMRSRRTKAAGKTARADLARAIHYITNQHRLGRMNYPEALARNYPIGTGVTEAAAKTVVGMRMKRAPASRSTAARPSRSSAQPFSRDASTAFTRNSMQPTRQQSLRDHAQVGYAPSCDCANRGVLAEAASRPFPHQSGHDRSEGRS